MTGKREEPGQTIDFILNRYESEDRAVAEKIRPLPASLVPSEQFVSQTRLHLLHFTASESGSRKAA